MARYVALLRGVNVGGIDIKMADVAKVFAALGFENVKTVLASGNVLFDTNADLASTKLLIEAALRDAFGYQAWVHVLEQSAVRNIVAAFPFDAEREGWHPYVIFVMDVAARAELLALQAELDPALESLAAGDNVVYWSVERGRTLNSVIGKASSRARYKQLTTTRNLRTLQKLLG